MPNLNSVLKAEITRVARKELRSETDALKGASAKYRSELAALKRQVASLEQAVKRIAKGADTATQAEAAGASNTRRRFSAKGLASQRKRLGLSAEALGKLIGVSGLSIYHWEAAKSRPREKYLPAIAALRSLGRKDAAAVLATR